MIIPFILISIQLYSLDFIIVKYKNGDAYNAREGVKNFLKEIRKRTNLDAVNGPYELYLDDDSIFQYYFLFINGHVPIQLSDKEKSNLKKFVLNGGFIFANDDFGMDESFRKIIKEIFPDYPFQEVSFTHPVYHCFYEMKNGIPKIHEHYEGPPKAFGLFITNKLASNRISIFYAYNSDIGDGWDLPEVHNDPPEKERLQLKWGLILSSMPRPIKFYN